MSTYSTELYLMLTIDSKYKPAMRRPDSGQTGPFDFYVRGISNLEAK